MSTRIWLSPPDMSGREQKYIQQAFDSNWVAPLGPNVDGFEKELSAYLNIPHTAVLISGTAAIHLALIILGVQREDEVIVQSFTFSATVNPVVYQGAIPVLVDSEPGSWNMDPVLLEEAISDRIRNHKKPKAIILVHLYGMPANVDQLLAIADKYDIPVIEDAAEAMGSRYNGLSCGTFGTIGILSFNGNKIITTSGGGALLSRNESFIARARFLATQARDDAPHYEHSQIGYNYRMSNVLAGIGRGQLEVLEERVASRRRINSLYREMLSGIPEIRFLTEPDEKYFSNYWLTTIIINPSNKRFTRELIRMRLSGDNIDSRPLWKPMHLQPVFKKMPAYENGTSQQLFEEGLCLPSGSNLRMEDIERIVDNIKALWK